MKTDAHKFRTRYLLVSQIFHILGKSEGGCDGTAYKPLIQIVPGNCRQTVQKN